MFVNISKYLLGTAVALQSCLSLAVADEVVLDSVLSDGSGYLAPVFSDDYVEPVAATTEVLSDDIELTQMLTPQRRPGMQVAQRPRRTTTAARSRKLSSVPFMIGDTGAGSCVSFNGLIDVELAHPTLACSRLNISESNTPLPTDRLFFSYRHFHNATPTRVYQFAQDFNLDRFTLGGERTFFDKMLSLEIRLPIDGRLSSDLITQVRDDIPVFSPLDAGREAGIGNISMVLKGLLREREDYAISAGLGVTLPTARDVNYFVDLLTNITFPSVPGLTSDTDVLLDINISNETFYLSPFLAWLWHPSDRWFHQGFCQVEVAANPSQIMLSGDGFNDFFLNAAPLGTLDWAAPFPAGRTDLIAQTLLRLNLGWGYTISENARADWIQKLTAMFEVHYTGTLNDANFGSVPVTINSSIGAPPSTSIDFGNRDNQVNIVNGVVGLSANMGNYVITNGITAPFTTGSNRGFDFEYNLQIQRPF